MKKLMMAVMFLAMAGEGQAAYFRTIDWSHPQVNAGLSIGEVTRPTTMVALVTHSPKDGYLLIPDVYWTPLAVGGGFKDNKFHVAVGPSMNLLPLLQSGFEVFLNAVTPADKYLNLKSIIHKAAESNGDIVGSAGINLEYDFADKRWSAPLFAGVSWKF